MEKEESPMQEIARLGHEMVAASYRAFPQWSDEQRALTLATSLGMALDKQVADRASHE